MRCAWKRLDGVLTVEVLVPANTAATVLLPAGSPDVVRERERPPAQAEGVTIVPSPSPGLVAVSVGGGDYLFTMPSKIGK